MRGPRHLRQVEPSSPLAVLCQKLPPLPLSHNWLLNLKFLGEISGVYWLINFSRSGTQVFLGGLQPSAPSACFVWLVDPTL